MSQTKILKLTAALLLMFTFLSCAEKKQDSQTVFPKPPKEKLDSVCTWLSKPKNYSKDKYFACFEKPFNEQLVLNHLDSAARLLNIAGEAAYLNYEFDTLLAQKHIDFLSKYENKIKPRFRSGLYSNLAELFNINEEFEKSKVFSRKNNFAPEDYYTELNISNSHRSLVYSFLITGQHDSAIVYGQKAMAFFEKMQDKRGQYAVYYDLSGIYRYMYNFSESEKYAKKSIEIGKELKDSIYIFDALYQLATVYEEMGSDAVTSSSDEIVSFEQHWKSSKPQHELAAQSFLAKKFFKDSNYVETGKILKRIASLYPLVKEDFYTEKYIEILADYETTTKQPLTLKKLYLEKIEKAEKNKYFAHLITYNSILSNEAIGLNDYKTAYHYLQKTFYATDSLQFNKVRQQATDFEKKYQTEKKEAQLQLQAEEAFIKNVFIAFLGLGLLALFYFYYTVRKKNTVISQQNELNEHTIAILSHDIKEPLLGVKLMLKKLNKDDPFVAQASQSLENQVTVVNGILSNLLKVKKLALSKKDKNAKANAKSVVQNVIQELNVAIQSKDLTIQNELPDELMLPIAPEKLQIIVNNLLSNAVKYSFPNQNIRIFQENNGFCIQDFGIGLSPEQRSKIMREVTVSSQGTKAERGNGLGLFLVGTMLQGEQIKVLFNSPEVGGTIVKVFG